MNPWLFGGLAALAAWFVLIFVAPVDIGAVHVLLAAGLVALVVWWGKREVGGSKQ